MKKVLCFLLALASGAVSAQIGSDWEEAYLTSGLTIVGPGRYTCEYRTMLSNERIIVRTSKMDCPMSIEYNWATRQWRQKRDW